jgi:hypothetical protein
VVLVGCLQELIVIAVLIETDARDLAHVKIRASSFRFGVIRVNPSKQFTVSTTSQGYRYSRYGLDYPSLVAEHGLRTRVLSWSGDVN